MSLLQQTEIYWVSILLLFEIYSERAIEEKHTFFQHAHLSIQSNRIDYEFTSIGCIIALQWLSWTVIFNLFMVHVILMAFLHHLHLLNGNSNVSNVRLWRWMFKTKPTNILSVTNVKIVKGIILFEFHFRFVFFIFSGCQTFHRFECELLWMNYHFLFCLFRCTYQIVKVL